MPFRLRAPLGALLVLTLCLATPQAPAGQSPDHDTAALFQAIERAAENGQPDAYLRLLASTADRGAASRFAQAQFGSRSTSATLRERDRAPLAGAPPGDGFRLIVEALFETGNRARLATWQLDVQRHPNAATAAESVWLIESQRQLSALDNLYRLALDTTRQLAGAGLVIRAPDLQLTLENGAVFSADADGRTAFVLVGKGDMTFSPMPAAERGQVAILAGAPALRTRFDTCVIRLNPDDLANHVRTRPAEQPVDPRLLQRAQQALAAASQSFALDLGDLSPGPWSIVPPYGDFVAEVRTPRFGTLTYARSTIEPEDIALFDRLHRRYIALYASRGKLAARGRFYTDDEAADYEALHYDVSASFDPPREWIEGRTRMVLRVRAAAVSALQVRLADGLNVRSAVLDNAGRVLAVRVRGRNAVIVTLPETLVRGAEVTLTIAYAGRLPPQTNRPDTATAEAAVQGPRGIPVIVEPSYLYSAAAPWYAQAPVNGFATATLHLTLPAPYTCVASGTLVSVSPTRPTSPTSRTSPTSPMTEFVFDAARPVRYLACLIGRLSQVKKTLVPLAGLVRAPVQAKPAGGGYGPSLVVTLPQRDAPAADSSRLDRPSLDGWRTWPAVTAEALTVVANREAQGQAEAVAADAEQIVRFYTSLVGDCPYPDLTVALVEREFPGGHSPAYLAILDRQAPASRLLWRNDPTAFLEFPDFFAAHEIAHQWWGQAIGTKNYHEAWLSEGFAQYFAALYAEHAHGPRVFADVMRRMQHWTLAGSSAGPVYLGDRVGQVKNASRALRAVVYDKSATVLHMLRRLLGNQVFFNGLRRFYGTWRFRKAGTDDLRKALEAESGMSLERFFERWIYADTLPRLRFSWRLDRRAIGRDEIVLRFEQEGEVFDLPVTVTIEYKGRESTDIVVPVIDRVVERRIPADGRVRKITANGDELTPVRIDK